MSALQFGLLSAGLALLICLSSTLAYAAIAHALNPDCATVLACVRL